MKKLSEKHKKHLINRSKKGHQSRNKKYNPFSAKIDPRYSHISPLETEFYKKIYAPINFTLKPEHCEDAIGYINRLNRFSRVYTKIEISLDKVENIGEGAISMLLSTVADIVDLGREVIGSYPNNPIAREILEKSGLFKYAKKIGEDKTLLSSKNKILTRGDYYTPPDEMALEVRKSMRTVWGVEGRNPLLYGGVFEMIRNSCDHAFKRRENTNWYFSITHAEDRNLVKYSFVDNGKGIVSTVLTGVMKKLFSLFNSNTELIDAAFKNGIESVTGLPWRGKGLPTIYELLEDRVVKNLVVITNDVYINLDSGVKMQLKNKFSGTYYYWEIDSSCERYCFES